MITLNASDKIHQFNQRGLHYNLVADAVYKERKSVSNPFDSKYLPYIIAALISFDMRRMMGSATGKYDIKKKGFAYYLSLKLNTIEPYITHLMNVTLDTLPLQSEKENIKTAYSILSSSGKDGLNRTGGGFNVGTTKILHFLNPEAFIIVDSNAARAFRQSHGVRFRTSTQPGYSSDKYLECMEFAKRDILNYGVKEFQALEEGIPICRIYDKLTFITGSKPD